MKALAIGDLHVGSGKRYGVTPGDRLRDQQEALERVVDLAIERRVDVVLNAGDTFHGPQVTSEEYAAFQIPARRLKEAGIPMLVCLGNGSHDLAMRDVPAPAVIADVAAVFTSPSLREVDGTFVAILPWVHYGRLVAEQDGGNRGEIMERAADELMTIARGLRAAVPDGAPCVLVTHFSISGASLPNGLPVADLREPILPLMELEAQGWDAVVAGHIHRRQFLSSGTYEATGPIFYTGSLLPVDFAEAELEHGATILTIDGDGVGVDEEFVPIASRRFVQIDVDLTAPDAFDRVEGNLIDETDLIAAAVAEHFPLDGAVVKIQYRATAEQERRLDHQALTQLALDAGASKVYAIVATIERDTRARMAGVDDTMEPLDALDAWIVANDLLDREDLDGRQLHNLTNRYLDEIGDERAGSVAGGLTPIRARARNYRSYADLDFGFPEGLVALTGENGSGKSSTINLVDLCLFAGRGELADLIRMGEDEMEISLEFESAGERYRVRRGLRRGKSQTVDLEQWKDSPLHSGDDTGPCWEPLSRENADATNRLIVEITGLTRATFRASVYLRQRDRSSFTDCGAAARKATLIEIIGLEEWEQLHARARTDLATAQALIADLDRLIELSTHAVAEKSTVEAALVAARGREQVAAMAISAAEAQIEVAQGRLAVAGSASERLRAAEAELASATTTESGIRQRVTEATAAAEQRTAAQQRLSEAAQLANRVPELEARVSELLGMKVKADTALAERTAIQQQALDLRADLERRSVELRKRDSQATELRHKASQLRDHDEGGDEPVCDRCEQHLGAEARARALASFDAEIALIDAAVREETSALAVLDGRVKETVDRAEQVSVPEVVDPAPAGAELVKARAASETRASLTAQLQAYAEKAAGLDRLHAELHIASGTVRERTAAVDEVKSTVVDTTSIDAEITAARIGLAQARTTADTAREQIGRATGQLEQIGQAETRLAADTSIRDATRADTDVLHHAVRAYSRDGVPALIVENSAIPQLEEHINELLRAFETSYTVELRTQREQKSGNVTETLDIAVYDGIASRPLETFSEGEQSVIALACRLALEHLLRSYGRRSSVLMIDEIEFLSQARQLLMVDVLRGILDQFESVILVTHSPAVAESVDRQIRFVKHDDVSRIDTPTAAPVELEAVAA